MSSIIAQRQEEIRRLLGRFADRIVPTSHVFVLLPDIWHPASSWNAVKAALEVAGNQVFSFDFTELLMYTSPQTLTVLDVAQYVASCIESQEIGNIYLVSWGTSGPVAQVLTSEHPQWFARVIFLDAYLLQPGESIFGLNFSSEGTQAQGDSGVLSFSECLDAETNLVQPPSISYFAGHCMPGATPEECACLYATLCAQPVGPLMDTPDVSMFWFRVHDHPYETFIGFHLPTTYIVSGNDQAVAPGFWESQGERLSYSSTLLLRDANHEAPVTSPLELTRALLTAADGFPIPVPAGLSVIVSRHAPVTITASV